MIRGPVLPLAREGLWQLVREQPERLERGLIVVCEDLELGTGELGLVDGLLRDAAGNPVLVMVTDDADAALLARVAAVHAFWQRNAAGMVRAIPEARLRDGAVCRLWIVTAGLPRATGELLARLGVDRLEIVELERFHIGDQERLVVRTSRPAQVEALGARSAEFDDSIGATARETLASVSALLARLDPRIRFEGDRFSRRATHEGRALCDYWFADDLVRGVLPAEEPCVLSSADDVRGFVDRVARRYLAIAGERSAKDAAAAAAPGSAIEPAVGAGRTGLDSLRASMSLARLSREEWTALGEAIPEEDPRSSG